MAIPDGNGGGEAGGSPGQTYHSDWMMVDQELVDRFADATFDHQYIHCDPVRAAEGPFSGTVAHGFLLLSLLSHLHARAGRPTPANVAASINYGFDRVRFVSPVRTGTRIRGRFIVIESVERQPGRFQQAVDAVIEIEGQDRPAVTARWLAQFVVST